MEENIQLRPKVTLRRKQAADITPSFKKMIVKLDWSSDVDLDLMVFYMTKSGESGGVFSSLLGVDGSGGSLESMPFIEHGGDTLGGNSDEKVETIKIASVENMLEVYVVVLNYEDAADNKTANFAQYGGQVSIKTDSGDNLEVPLESTEIGHVAVICKIDNSTGKPSLINENRVLSLNSFIKEIPGAKLLLS
jgi:tellurite resistance protein TerA